MSRQTILAVSFALLCSSSLWGQPRARGGSSSGGGAVSAPAASPSPSASSSSGSIGGGYSTASYPRSRGIYSGPAAPMPDPYSISGQVDMPGGGDPPEPPRIQRVCGSQVDTVAYCDRRGRFNFNLMRNAWSLTPPGAFGFGYFNSCGLRAYMPGFYSPLFSLANRGPYAWPEIGKFRLTSQPGVEGAAVSLTTLAAPKLAKKHFEKALRHLRDAKLEKAAAELELAVEEYPDYAAAWTLLGELRQQLGHESGIREAYERALEADSRYLRPFAPLIRIEIAEGNYEQAAELAERAVRLNPLSAELHYHLALAKYKLGDKEKARYHARKAVESDDIAEAPAAYALYGDILAQAGERAEAADQYRRFIALHPNLPTSQELRLQLQAWGEPVVSAVPQKAEARK